MRKPNLVTALKAREEYFNTGNVTVKCEVCQEPIEMKPLSSEAWQMTCKCGLYNHTQRGL